METLATVLSILALVVAGASFVLACLAYRRGGARVQVRTAQETSGTYAGVEMTWEVIAIHVTNRGLAETQVTEVGLEIEGVDGRIPANEGPRLNDYGLQGHRAERWAVEVKDLASAAGLVPEGKTVRYRACVTLGSDHVVHSKWCTYSVNLST